MAAARAPMSRLASRLSPRAPPMVTSTARRAFQTSSRMMEAGSTPLPVRKPVGAFRGGIFGFLLGSTLSGAGVYYYILEEYKVSNELLMEDVFALQSAVQRIEGYVRGLEEQLNALEKKK